MTVYSKFNIILPGPDGQKFRLPRGYIGPVPAWAEKSPYLKALVKDEKVIITQPKTKKRQTENPGEDRKPAENPGEEQ